MVPKPVEKKPVKAEPEKRPATPKKREISFSDKVASESKRLGSGEKPGLPTEYLSQSKQLAKEVSFKVTEEQKETFSF